MAMILGEAKGIITLDISDLSSKVSEATSQLGQLDNISASGLDQFESKLNAAGTSSKQLGMGMVTVGGAILGTFGVGAKHAMDFEAALANVNSIAKFTPQELESTNKQLLAMAQNTGKGPTELANALYDVQSSGFSGAEGMGVLQVAVDAANAGLVQTPTAVKAISSVLNAYGMDAKEASNVSDVLFQVVESGVITFEELSTSMGRVLPIASTMGVTIDEVGAAYGTMTKQGMNASAAETNLAAVLNAAMKPTEALSDAVKAKGYASAEAMIATEGLTGFLDLLTEATGGSAEEMANLMGSSQATRGALALTGEGADIFKDTLKLTSAALGDVNVTQEALARQTDTTAFAIARLRAAFQVGLIQAGEMVTPIIRRVADAMIALINVWLGAPDIIRKAATAFALVSGVLLTMGGTLLLLLPKIVNFVNVFRALGGLSGMVGVLSTAVRILASSLMGLVFANPLLLGLAAAAALVGVAFKTNFLGIGDAVRTGIGHIKGAWDSFKGFFDAPQIGSATKEVEKFGGAIQSVTGTGADGLDWFVLGPDGERIGDILSSKAWEDGTVSMEVKDADGVIRTLIENEDGTRYWKVDIVANETKAMGAIDRLQLGLGRIKTSLNERGINFLDPLFTGAQKGLSGIQALGGGFDKLKGWWGDFKSDFAGTRGIPGMDFMDRIASAWRTSSMFGNNPLIEWAASLRDNVEDAWGSLQGFAGRIPLIGGTVSRVMGSMGESVGKFTDGFAKAWRESGDMNVFERGIAGLAEGLRSVGFEGAAGRVTRVATAISSGLGGALSKGRDFVDAFRFSWDIMSKTAGPFAGTSSTLEKGLRSIGFAFEAIGLGRVADMFGGLADRVDYGTRVFDQFRRNGAGPFKSTIGALQHAIPGLTVPLNLLYYTVQGGQKVFGLLWDGMKAGAGVLRDVGVSAWGGIQSGIGKVVDVASTGIGKVTGFFGGIRDSYNEFVDVSDRLIRMGVDPVSASMMAFEKVFPRTTKVLKATNEAIVGVASTIRGGFSRAITSGRDFIDGFADAWKYADKVAGPFMGKMSTTEKLAFALGEGFRSIGMDSFADSIANVSERLHSAFADRGWVGLITEGLRIAGDAILSFAKGAGAALKDWTLDVAVPKVTGWLATLGSHAWDAIKAAAGWAGGLFGAAIDKWDLNTRAADIRGWVADLFRDPWGVISKVYGGLQAFRADIRDWYIDIAEPNIAGKLIDIDNWLTEKLGLDSSIRMTIHDWWLDVGAPALNKGTWELASLIIDLLGTAVVTLGANVWSLMMGRPTIVLGFDIQAAFQSAVGRFVMWSAEALTNLVVSIVNDPMKALKVFLIAALTTMLATLFFTGGITALLTLGTLLGLAALGVAVINAIRGYFRANPTKIDELKLKIDRVWAALEGIRFIGPLFGLLRDIINLVIGLVNGFLKLRNAMYDLGGPFGAVMKWAEMATLAIAGMFAILRLGGFGKEIEAVTKTVMHNGQKITVTLADAKKVRFAEALLIGLRRVAAFPFRLIFRPLDTLKGMFGIMNKNAKTGVGSFSFWTKKASKDGKRLVVHWDNFAHAFRRVGQLVGFTAGVMADTFRFLMPDAVTNRISARFANLRLRIVKDLDLLADRVAFALDDAARHLDQKLPAAISRMGARIRAGFANAFPETGRAISNARKFFQGYRSGVIKGLNQLGDDLVRAGATMGRGARALSNFFTAPIPPMPGGGQANFVRVVATNLRIYGDDLVKAIDNVTARATRGLTGFWKGINQRQGGAIQARRDMDAFRSAVMKLPNAAIRAGRAVRTAFSGMFNIPLVNPAARMLFDMDSALRGATLPMPRLLADGTRMLGPFFDELRPIGPMLDDLAPRATRFQSAITSIGQGARAALSPIRGLASSFSDEFARGIRAMGGLRPLAGWIRNLGPVGRIAAAGISLLTGGALFKGGFLDGIIGGIKGMGSGIASAFSALSGAFSAGGWVGVVDLIVSQAGAFFSSLPGRIADLIRNANWSAVATAMLFTLSAVMMGPWGLLLGLFAPMIGPVIGDAIDGIAKIISGFASGGLKGGFDAMGKVVENGVKSIGKGLDRLGDFFTNLADPIARIPVVGRPLAWTLRTMGSGFSSLGSAISGIAPTVAAFVVSIGQSLVSGVQAAWSAITGQMGPAFASLMHSIGDLLNPLRDIGSAFMELFSGDILTGLKNLGIGFLDLGKGVLDVGADLATFVGDAIEGLGLVGEAILDGLANRFPVIGDGIRLVGDAFRLAFSSMGGVLQTVGNLVRGDFSAAWSSLQGVFTDALGAIATGLMGLGSIVMDAFRSIDWSGVRSSVVEAAQSALSNLVLALGTVALAIAGWAKDTWDDAWTWLRQRVTGEGDGKLSLGSVALAVAGWAKDTWNDAWAWLRETVVGEGDGSVSLGSILVSVAGWAAGAISDVWAWLQGHIGGGGGFGEAHGMGGASTSYARGVDLGSIKVNILEWVKGAWSDLTAWVQGKVSSEHANPVKYGMNLQIDLDSVSLGNIQTWNDAVQGIKNDWEKAKEAASWFSDTFSLPANITDFQSVVEGLKSDWELIKSGMETVAGWIPPAMGSWDGVVEGLKNDWETIKDGMETVAGWLPPGMGTWDEVVSGLKNDWDTIKSGMETVADWLPPGMGGWEDLVSGLQNDWESIKSGMGTVADWVAPAIDAWAELVDGAASAWETIKGALDAASDWTPPGLGGFQTASEAIANAWDRVVDAWNQMTGDAPEHIGPLGEEPFAAPPPGSLMGGKGGKGMANLPGILQDIADKAQLATAQLVPFNQNISETGAHGEAVTEFGQQAGAALAEVASQALAASSPAITGFNTAVQESQTILLGFVGEVTSLLSAFGTEITGTFETARVAFETTAPSITTLQTAFETFMTTTTGHMTSWRGDVESAVNGTMDTLQSRIPTTMSEVQNAVRSATSDMEGKIRGWKSSLEGDVRSAMGTVKSEITSRMSEASNALSGSARDMEGRMSDARNTIVGHARTMGTDVSSNIRNGFAEATAAIGAATGGWAGIISNASGAMNSAGYSAGLAAAWGVRDGINAGRQSAINAASSLATAVANAMSSALQSSSPSKVTTKIGTTVPWGLEVGIDKGAPKAVSAAQELAERVRDAMEGVFSSSVALPSLTEAGQGMNKLGRAVRRRPTYAERRSSGGTSVYNDNRTTNVFALKSEEWVKMVQDVERAPDRSATYIKQGVVGVTGA